MEYTIDVPLTLLVELGASIAILSNGKTKIKILLKISNTVAKGVTNTKLIKPPPPPEMALNGRIPFLWQCEISMDASTSIYFQISLCIKNEIFISFSLIDQKHPLCDFVLLLI